MQKKTSKYIEEFLNFLRMIQQEYDYSLAQESEMNGMTQDILHCLELENISYHERARLAGYLKEVRQERRRYKDAVEEFEDIVSLARNNKKLLNELEQMLGAVRKKENCHTNRSYHMRLLNAEMLDQILARKKGD